MKKIMFSDKFGLTQAVLNGRKTMTRRIIKGNGIIQAGEIQTVDIIDGVVHLVENNYDESCNDDFGGDDGHIALKLPYEVGEVVAIAQRYSDLINNDIFYELCAKHYMPYELIKYEKGYNNKMLVAANLMPHHIRIANVRVERLQDISGGDCLREGVVKRVLKLPAYNKDPSQYLIGYYPCQHLIDYEKKVGWRRVYSTPQAAFAELIDFVSCKGTWDSNPWVSAYEFELVD